MRNLGLRGVTGLLGSAVLALSVVGAVIPVGASPAAAAAVRGAGYVLADPQPPPTGCYHPDPQYSRNTSNVWDMSGTLNEICRTGTGRYTVRFRNLGFLGGVAHATAYGEIGSTIAQCKVLNWYVSGADQLVNVFCHTIGGSPVDSRFTASYTNVKSPPSQLSFLPNSSFGYLWSGSPSTGCWTASSTYQYHSRGGSSQICKIGVGHYQVSIPNQISHIGNVQVTASGSGTQRCKVDGWGSSVTVRCFVGGTPADSAFSLSYVRDGNILGLELCCHPNGHHSVYAKAFSPTSSEYDLGHTYQFNMLPSYTGTGFRDEMMTGYYGTRYSSSLEISGGTVHVTAYGSGGEFCMIAFWNMSSGIWVHCYDAYGIPAEAQYTVAFTGNWLLG